MLETQRLIIRPAISADAFHLFTLNSDPEVMKYTGDTRTKSVIDAQNLIRDQLTPQFLKHKMARFMVFRKQDNTFIGWCGLKYFPETREVDLGYRLMKKFWSQGYATEAGRACLEYGFQKLALERIIAKTMPENVASIKVMQKLGMTFRGFVHDPTDPMPFVLYDIKKSEFR
jgi:[ribosomal protein S5]-alanine N-acetyltransferase